MMSTQKKLTRPSDDPIIAIRALRLRTSVSEISQFREKNAEDAKAWLTVTEDALETVTKILSGETGITKLTQRAANKDITPTDINILMQQILSLRDEFYSTANVDYAGRYIFTGYRTDTTLSFTKDVEARTTLSYNITEQFTLAGFDTVNYTDLKDLANLTKSNYSDPAFDNVTEQDIENIEIPRLRLSYDNTALEANADLPVISYVNTLGAEVEIIGGGSGIAVTEVSANQVYPALDPYQTIKAMNEAATPVAGAVYIPETGEILLSNAAFAAITDDPAIVADTELRVNYTKDKWLTGDLRPEHYFACTSTENIGTALNPNIQTIDYNMGKLDGSYKQQAIEYDVGYNQKIQVNTLAEDVFRHGLDRNVDDLNRAVQTLLDIEATMNGLESLLDETSPDYELIQKQYDAARKAYDYTREMVHGMFEKAITSMQDALNAINVAVTDSGTRSARLDLISNRLLSQQTTFEVLRSENENADIADVAIKLTSAELSYNAALMATGKIMQTSLLNYM
jgi:flagellar hook-associated protein 3 FlgL